MSEEIARYRYGTVLRHVDPRLLELRWHPATEAMSDEDWSTGLLILAAEAEAARPTALLIDATDIGHSFADRAGMMRWRDQHVIPRYNNSGVQRFAFLMPPAYSGPTAEQGSEPAIDGETADFPTQWFHGRETALSWLAG